MSITLLFYIVVGLTALERLAELVIGTQNRKWSMAKGGREYGQEHWPSMVVLHTLFLVLMVLEVLALPTLSSVLLTAFMFTVAVLAQGLRWWCIHSLGRRWNPRIIVIPGLSPVSDGPYRWFKHPNYIAVVIEGIALPMIHGAWRTALFFSLCNALLLRVRIRCENQALKTLESS
jgi:methyltransferase